MTFRTTILTAGKTATGISLPPEIVDWPLNIVVVRSGDRTILVDAGLGSDPDLHLPRAGQLVKRLAAAGIQGPLGSVLLGIAALALLAILAPAANAANLTTAQITLKDRSGHVIRHADCLTDTAANRTSLCQFLTARGTHKTGRQVFQWVADARAAGAATAAFTESGDSFTGTSTVQLDGAIKGAPPIACPDVNPQTVCPFGVPSE